MPAEWLGAIGAAGPYMGTAIFMALVQILVILRVADKVLRVRALYITIGVQVVALAAGLFVNFLRDI